MDTATFIQLGGSDMNWVGAMFNAVIFIICLWVFVMAYTQLTRQEISFFNLFMLMIRIGVVITVSSGVTLWMT